MSKFNGNSKKKQSREREKESRGAVAPQNLRMILQPQKEDSKVDYRKEERGIQPIP